MGSGETTYDCTKIDGYKNLKTENFFIVATSNISVSASGDASGGPWRQSVSANYTPPTYSYDANTGKLTVNAAKINVSGSVDSTPAHNCSNSANSTGYKAYCVKGSIQSL